MCTNGTGATTSTTNQNQNVQYTPYGQPLFADIYNRAQTVASQPYTPYTGELVAPMNGYQWGGLNQIMDYSQAAQPYLSQAGSWTNNAYNQANNAYNVAGGGLPWLQTGAGNIGAGANVISSAQNPLSTGQNMISGGYNAIGAGQNYLPAASAYTAGGAQGVGNLSAGDISQYMNPYQQQVIQATLGNMAENNAQQQLQVQGNAAMRGALGGDRVGVAQAELARQQALANNQTLAGLNAQNYQQATATALAQQQNAQANAARMLQAGNQFSGLGATQAGIGTQLAGAGNAMTGAAGQQAGIGNLLAGTGLQYSQLAGQQSGIGGQMSNIAGTGGQLAGQYGNIGTQVQNAGQTGGQNLMTAGLTPQQTQQALDTANYQQYQQQLAFPYQQVQFLSGIGVPAASAMGGFQTQIGNANQTLTPPGMSWQQALVGGGALLGGLLNQASGGRIPQRFASGGSEDSSEEDTDPIRDISVRDVYGNLSDAMDDPIVPTSQQITAPDSKPTPFPSMTSNIPNTSQQSQSSTNEGLTGLGKAIGKLVSFLPFEGGGRIPRYADGGLAPTTDTRFQSGAPSGQSYFSLYPDVAAAYEGSGKSMSPSQFASQHYMDFGKSEGRYAPAQHFPSQIDWSKLSTAAGANSVLARMSGAGAASNPATGSTPVPASGTTDIGNLLGIPGGLNVLGNALGVPGLSNASGNLNAAIPAGSPTGLGASPTSIEAWFAANPGAAQEVRQQAGPGGYASPQLYQQIFNQWQQQGRGVMPSSGTPDSGGSPVAPATPAAPAAPSPPTEASTRFLANAYLAANPDVANAIKGTPGTPGDPGQPISWSAQTYFNANPDVAAAYQSYSSGLNDARGPDQFNGQAYLAANPDVAAAGVDPWTHWQNYGKAEGRTGGFAAPMSAERFAAQHWNQFGEREGRTGFFNEPAYLAANPDVAKAGVDASQHYFDYGSGEGRGFGYTGATPATPANPGLTAWQHYQQFGQNEGRPGIFFNPQTYLAANPDVKSAGVDPWQHYQQFGLNEGRVGTYFNPQKYLAANPDVKAAGVDPLQHWQTFGINEGRTGAWRSGGAVNSYANGGFLGGNPYNFTQGPIPPVQGIKTPKVNVGELMNIRPMMDISKAASAIPGITPTQMEQLGTVASRLMSIKGGSGGSDDGEAAGGRIRGYANGGSPPFAFDPTNRFPYPGLLRPLPGGGFEVPTNQFPENRTTDPTPSGATAAAINAIASVMRDADWKDTGARGVTGTTEGDFGPDTGYNAPTIDRVFSPSIPDFDRSKPEPIEKEKEPTEQPTAPPADTPNTTRTTPVQPSQMPTTTLPIPGVPNTALPQKSQDRVPLSELPQNAPPFSTPVQTIPITPDKPAPTPTPTPTPSTTTPSQTTVATTPTGAPAVTVGPPSGWGGYDFTAPGALTTGGQGGFWGPGTPDNAKGWSEMPGGGYTANNPNDFNADKASMAAVSNTPAGIPSAYGGYLATPTPGDFPAATTTTTTTGQPDFTGSATGGKGGPGKGPSEGAMAAAAQAANAPAAPAPGYSSQPGTVLGRANDAFANALQALGQVLGWNSPVTPTPNATPATPATPAAPPGGFPGEHSDIPSSSGGRGRGGIDQVSEADREAADQAISDHAAVNQAVSDFMSSTAQAAAAMANSQSTPGLFEAADAAAAANANAMAGGYGMPGTGTQTMGMPAGGWGGSFDNTGNTTGNTTGTPGGGGFGGGFGSAGPGSGGYGGFGSPGNMGSFGAVGGYDNNGFNTDPGDIGQGFGPGGFNSGAGAMSAVGGFNGEIGSVGFGGGTGTGAVGGGGGGGFGAGSGPAGGGGGFGGIGPGGGVGGMTTGGTGETGSVAGTTGQGGFTSGAGDFSAVGNFGGPVGDFSDPGAGNAPDPGSGGNEGVATDTAGNSGNDGNDGSGGGDGVGVGARGGRFNAAGGAVHDFSYLQAFQEGGDTPELEEKREDDPPALDIPTVEQPYRVAQAPVLTADKLREAGISRGPIAGKQPFETRFSEWDIRPSGATVPAGSSIGTETPIAQPRPTMPPLPERTVGPAPGTAPARPSLSINPYDTTRRAAAAPPAGGGMDPTKTGWSEIMNPRSPMYQNAAPQRKTMREMLSDPRSRGDFLTRLGVGILAADPSRGWGSTIGQGLAGTVKQFDTFANEDWTARQKAQDLASRIKKHAETLGESRLTHGETARHHKAMEDIYRDRLTQESWKDIPYTTKAGDPVIRNMKTGEARNGRTHEPLPDNEPLVRVGPGAGGRAANSPQMMRYQLAQIAYPNDPKKAAEVALGIRPPTDLQIDSYLVKNFPQLVGKSPAEIAAFRERFKQEMYGGAKIPTGPIAKPLPADKSLLEKGELYDVPGRGRARWDGANFTPE